MYCTTRGSADREISGSSGKPEHEKKRIAEIRGSDSAVVFLMNLLLFGLVFIGGVKIEFEKDAGSKSIRVKLTYTNDLSRRAAKAQIISKKPIKRGGFSVEVPRKPK